METDGRITNRLKECMAQKQINQSQLARRLGKSASYVSRLVKGDVRPGVEVLFRAAKYFDRPVEEIFQWEDKAAPQ